MDAPTAADIRTWSQALWDEWGYPAPEGSDPDPLTRLITQSVSEMESLVSIDLAAIDESTDKRAPLIEEVIQKLVEYRASSGQAEMIETGADFDMLSSFSAGGYSETRRNLGGGRNVLHPWPQLNRLLLGILYFDSGGRARDGTPAVGQPVPDWEHARDIINAKRFRSPFSPGGPGVYVAPWNIGEIQA